MGFGVQSGIKVTVESFMPAHAMHGQPASATPHDVTRASAIASLKDQMILESRGLILLYYEPLSGI